MPSNAGKEGSLLDALKKALLIIETELMKWLIEATGGGAAYICQALVESPN